MEKKLDGNYTRMLRAILNKSWRQRPTKQQLHGHLPPITRTIQVRRTRHVGHCWRSNNELISDILLWTPSHGRAKLCPDTGYSLEDLPGETGCERWSGISVLAARHDDDVKVRIDKTQQNSKCRLCGAGDKTINTIKGTAAN